MWRWDIGVVGHCRKFNKRGFFPRAACLFNMVSVKLRAAVDSWASLNKQCKAMKRFLSYFKQSLSYVEHLNWGHRLYTEFIWAPCHVMCTSVLIFWDSATSPIPPHFDSYTRCAIGQQRQTTSLCNPLAEGLGCWAKKRRNTLKRWWHFISDSPFKMVSVDLRAGWWAWWGKQFRTTGNPVQHMESHTSSRGTHIHT